MVNYWKKKIGQFLEEKESVNFFWRKLVNFLGKIQLGGEELVNFSKKK